VLWYRSEIDVKGDAYYCRLGVDIAYLRLELGEESGAPDSRLKVLQTCLHVYTSMYARVSFNPVNTTYICEHASPGFFPIFRFFEYQQHHSAKVVQVTHQHLLASPFVSSANPQKPWLPELEA
jgi:hypothetical protein